jgi:hypothetical protein
MLQQLPKGLAIAVLAASPADLEHHLHILPASLHQQAIEAAFSPIRRHRSLSLDFDSLRDPITLYALLHAATAGITGTRALKELELKNIPDSCDSRLLQMISDACRSASDVQLDLTCSTPHAVPTALPFVPVGFLFFAFFERLCRRIPLSPACS